jgi:hypothetical protein
MERASLPTTSRARSAFLCPSPASVRLVRGASWRTRPMNDYEDTECACGHSDEAHGVLSPASSLGPEERGCTICNDWSECREDAA